MSIFPKREIVEKIKADFPPGTRIVLVQMDDPQAPRLGTKGTVNFVDDTGTIHPYWDGGGSLGVVYGKDICRKVDPVTVTCYGKAEKWEDRLDAMSFYKEAMLGCDRNSHEYQRYSAIWNALSGGSKEATDEGV